MTIEIRTSPNGVLLPVKAQASAKRNAIVGEHAGRLKVAVTAVAEKGKANASIIKLLAKELSVSKSRVQLVAGETSSLKTIEILAIEGDELAERIALYCE